MADSTLDAGGALWFKGRICLPWAGDMIYGVLYESYGSCYSIYLGATKIYHDLRKLYWCLGIKRDILEHEFKCLNY